jgi:hypothetical protein
MQGSLERAGVWPHTAGCGVLPICLVRMTCACMHGGVEWERKGKSECVSEQVG